MDFLFNGFEPSNLKLYGSATLFNGFIPMMLRSILLLQPPIDANPTSSNLMRPKRSGNEHEDRARRRQHQAASYDEVDEATAEETSCRGSRDHHPLPLSLRWNPLLPSLSPRGSWRHPQFQNSDGYPASPLCGCITACDPSHVHIAMTLDSHYLHDSIVAVFSILKHAFYPESIFFHFVASTGPSSSDLYRTVRSVFRSLMFKIYPFQENLVCGLISASVREVLKNPLNYARNYLTNLLKPCVKRVIYVDSDLIVVDDIRRLWDMHLPESAMIAMPEYYRANFTRYFMTEFWESGDGQRIFYGRQQLDEDGGPGVPIEDRVLDEDAADKAVLRAGVAAGFPASVCRRGGGGGPLLEPARPRRSTMWQYAMSAMWQYTMFLPRCIALKPQTPSLTPVLLFAHHGSRRPSPKPTKNPLPPKKPPISFHALRPL